MCPKTLEGVQLTTSERRAKSLSDCVCPIGTYAPRSGSIACAPCPDGMSCVDVNTSESAIPAPDGPESLFPYIKAAPGYMTLKGNPMKPYKCRLAAACPGKRAGTCDLGRDPDTIACGACPAQMYPSSGGRCLPCGGSSASAALGAVISAVMAVLTVAALRIQRQDTVEPRPIATIIAVSVLTLLTIQSLGVVSNMSVTLVEPMNSAIRSLAVLSFNFDVVEPDCLLSSAAWHKFLIRQSVAPAAAAYLMVAVMFRRRFRKEVRFSEEMCNVVGSLYQALFVSMVLSIVLPFVCFKHPSSAGSSMRSMPEVLCFDSAEHNRMVAVSAVSMLGNIVPYMALIGFATLRYKRAVSDSSMAANFLQKYRFLFFRYQPACFYWSSLGLARSILLCMTPVVFTTPAVQVIVMTLVLLLFQVLQLFLQPWRSPAANVMDAFLATSMIILMVCIALTGDFSNTASVVGVVGTVIVVLALAVAAAVATVSIYKRCVPSPFYTWFVCHHKADAAGQARYLQLLLKSQSGCSCFIDSDHLVHLDDLLDIVRCRLGTLVVYLTSVTMRRPWCAGEMATIGSIFLVCSSPRLLRLLFRVSLDIWSGGKGC